MYSHVFPMSAKSDSVSFPTRRLATSLIAMQTYDTLNWNLGKIKERGGWYDVIASPDGKRHSVPNEHRVSK